ncbi:hypothetical protein Pla22_07470 [Rubripirellula amarantea]|uniref:DUF1501 domain-containing protein n=1 Tax=Rubripirellula amarantea TaxID=2527999 RepID=A0A5C5WSI4_9BACT|nr:DUF1501 domain-containing protein [Rubripirellula amarantea]TWT53119.1 hypothetical protein Pla22_07470 [Rubripirellula amarantea]
MNSQPIIKRGLESRRSMLKMAGGCAALTNTSLLSTILNLSATNAAVAQSGNLTDYKAIVCLFLFGGNDSFNMITPTSGSDTSGERKNYLDSRGGVYAAGNGALGLAASQLHTINDPSGRTFGLHPELGDLKTLYDAGKLTFVCNVGSLVEPTTRAQYNTAASLPLGLFSHSDLQRHWMTSVPQTRSQVTGWAGRMADLLTNQTNNNDSVSMNIALDSVNMMQTGSGVVPYVIRSNGAQEVSWYSKNPTWYYPRMFSQLTDDVLSRSYGNLLERTFAEQNRTALDAAIGFNQATSSITTFDNLFANVSGDNDGNRLRGNFKMIAKSIAARDTIDQKRQVFFVGLGGFDNHDELILNQTSTMARVNSALSDFQAAMDLIGMTDNVLTFTASDFARTLNSNGRGSDHAWGGNQIVMGGPVNGNRIHGQYPMNLANVEDGLDLGRGRLIPTTSVDEMAAEIAMWYGIDNDTNLEQVLPNIRNFHAANAGAHPIGMLS